MTPELLPFITSYCASALALHATETKKLKFLDEAFSLFQKAVTTYAAVSYLPEFLRGSVAENLPWYFFAKRRCASHDFQSIIDKYTENAAYANWKVMSFTYWARAKQQSGKKHRAQALAYLEQAIELDPHYKAGRAKAEELQHMLTK